MFISHTYSFIYSSVSSLKTKMLQIFFIAMYPWATNKTWHIIGTEGEQNMPPQNMPLQYVAYFELEAVKTQQTQEKVTSP